MIDTQDDAVHQCTYRFCVRHCHTNKIANMNNGTKTIQKKCFGTVVNSTKFS